MIGIYKITNPNGKIYIGQTIDYKRRLRHYKLLRCKEQPRVYNSLVKYGIDKHKFKLIKECAKEELTQWERHFQELYDSVGKNGLNCILVATNEFSGGHSEESKKKISEGLKGRTFSPEHRAKIAEANRNRVISDETRYKLGNGNRGKRQNEEWRLKGKVARTGLVRSEETKRKISEAMKGKAKSDEHKFKLSQKVVTEELRLKLSIAAKNRKNKNN